MKRPEPKHPDIIYRPDLVPKRRRALFSGITLIAWVIWAYLFLPLVNLLAWYLGYELFSHHVLDLERSVLIGTLQAYGLVIACAGLVIIGWSRYHVIRFRGRERRTPIEDVSAAMLSERFQVDLDTIARLQGGKNLIMHLDSEGMVLSVQENTGEIADSDGESGFDEQVLQDPNKHEKPPN